jgi:hypothetical protein
MGVDQPQNGRWSNTGKKQAKKMSIVGLSVAIGGAGKRLPAIKLQIPKALFGVLVLWSKDAVRVILF